MTFKQVLELILILAVSFVFVSVWITVLLSSLSTVVIRNWFKEREAYVKRIGMITDSREHEYDSVTRFN